MSIYLCIKTHRKTGLKYLCKTIRTDYDRYSGSGKYWKNHLRVHGKDFDTELLRECSSEQELKEWGIYYSNLWNIVESDEWANLKPEEGDGGDPGPIGRAKISESKIGKKHSIEQNNNKSKRQLGTKKSQSWLEKRVGMKYQRRKTKNEWTYVGDNHWNTDKRLYEFEHKKTGERKIARREEFGKLIQSTHVGRLISGERKTAKGWRFIGIA